MITKKIFLIISSLGAGGSERVYWLLSQYFNNADYEVTVVLLNGNECHFSTKIAGIKFVNLNTIKASRSFFKLRNLIRDEKPYAVFSTTDHINILVALVSIFVKIPHLIARGSNNPQQMKEFYGLKARFYNYFSRFLFVRFNSIVCQSEEMRQAIAKLYNIDLGKLIVIHNPVITTEVLRPQYQISGLKRLIAVSRLIKEKGLFRLLEVMKALPQNYVLTIAGDGPLMNKLKAEADTTGIKNRITFIGEINNVTEVISKHNVLVLSSFTEGFPNVILESLSVGVPVVTFRVGGVNELIKEGFNGFIAEQNDLCNLRKQIIRACNQTWQHRNIKADIIERFGLNKIGRAYEILLSK
ncbi:Glycosyltransferase involved in cell wall bisynthesis [Mucilaginibacter pineti]|uniref:Glycosyltransferase involved in cell wall bisynthesis n=1 Tax=Mucilaginibacter pineti TaxID=1391627 RepID=A0A1G6XG33_9SPHI|nr:glycosyltransferase [Mucilaginibacter pineti]SDD76285.1 Glycosyltransferase involved in cell wall bisynthesis [Mucilaginibacter pineti]